MNVNLNINWGRYADDDSSSDSDSSDFSDDTSASGISGTSKLSERYVLSKQELQKLLDSNKPRDKDILNAKIDNIVRQDSQALFMYLIANNYKLEVLNDKGQSALHLAWYYRSNILSFIVEFPNYITENHTDCNGLNYLHIGSFIAHEKLVCRCLKQGVDVNSQFHSDPKGLRSKFTPLHYAASVMLTESRKVMKRLLNNGADVNAVDYQGRTPLHIACQIYEELFLFSDILDSCSSVKFLKILLENGSDPNAKDNNGNTALLSIISDCYNEFGYEMIHDTDTLPYIEIQEKLKYFLKKRVDFLAINNDGNNILHRIIENLKLTRYPKHDSIDFSYDVEYAKMIKQILVANTGIDVNAKNCFGDTPLQLAVSLMSFDVVKVLLEHNASLDSLTFSHDDEYCFCCPNSYPTLDIIHKVISIIKLLLKKGWKLTFQDNLLLMRFLVHDVDNCECGNIPVDEYDITSIIPNLIDCGCAQHFEKIMDKVITELSAPSRSFSKDYVLKDISKVLHYRKVFNLYIDRKIIDAAKKHMNSDCTIIKPKYSIYRKNDVVRMKFIKLKCNVSLYDVMTRHPHRIYGYVKNENFNEITEHLMYLGNVVKGHVAKSLVRHHIEKMAVQYLKLLLFPAIPNLCCKQILGLLSNAEIINACSAAILEEE